MGLYQKRFMYFCITLFAVASISLTIASCQRPARIILKPAGTEAPAMKTAEPSIQAETLKAVDPEPSRTVEMRAGRGTPSPGTPGSTTAAAKKPAPRVAESLAGHDRHLVHRPLDTIEPSDFEIGPLINRSAYPELAARLALLEKAILGRRLPDGLFTPEAATIAAILFAEDLKVMPATGEVRFSTPQTQAGGTIAVALRIIVAKGQGHREEIESSALGTTILAPDSKSLIRIEHIEIDTASLDVPAVRSTLWDPYSLNTAP